MRPHLYFILLALAGDDRHGLGIAREVQQLSDGAVRLWPATLYGALEDLVQQGWIEELIDTDRRPENESEKKRFYRLTRTGRTALLSETDRLSALVRSARARIKRAGEAS